MIFKAVSATFVKGAYNLDHDSIAILRSSSFLIVSKYALIVFFYF